MSLCFLQNLFYKNIKAKINIIIFSPKTVEKNKDLTKKRKITFYFSFRNRFIYNIKKNEKSKKLKSIF